MKRNLEGTTGAVRRLTVDSAVLAAIPLVERKLGCGGEGRRGVFGKSSGGYGALTHALLHPDFWSACACHSGDLAFDLVYLPDMPRTLRALAKEGGSIQRWLEAFFA